MVIFISLILAKSFCEMVFDGSSVPCIRVQCAVTFNFEIEEQEYK